MIMTATTPRQQTPMPDPPVPRRPRGHAFEIVLAGVCAVLIALLALPPLGTLIFSSFKNSTFQIPFTVPGFSVANYERVFGNSELYSVLGKTLLYAGAGVVIALALCIVIAFLLEKTNIPFRHALTTMTLSPLAIPPLVLALAWIYLANPSNGIYTRAVANVVGIHLNVYTMPGMILVSVIIMVPSMYLMIAPALSSIDSSLEDAGRFGGVRGITRLRLITVALLRPALLGSAVYFVIVGIESFEVPAILGLPNHTFLLSTLIYKAVQPTSGSPNYGEASTYGVLLLVIALLLVIGYRRLTAGAARYQTFSSRSYRRTRFDLGRYRALGSVAVFGYSLIFVIGPLLALLWASFLPIFGMPSMTTFHNLQLTNYRTAIGEPTFTNAIVNTIIVALVSATVTILLAALSSWLTVFRGSRLGALSSELGFLILGVPGIILGVGISFFYLESPIPIYGTTWIIVVAYITRFYSFAARLMDAAFKQLNKEMEDAGRTLGCSSFTCLRTITLPLLWPTLLRGWFWVLVHAIREVPMATLLYVYGNEMFAVLLWNSYQNSTSLGITSAYAVMLTAVSLILTIVMNRMNSRQTELFGVSERTRRRGAAGLNSVEVPI